MSAAGARVYVSDRVTVRELRQTLSHAPTAPLPPRYQRARGTPSDYGRAYSISRPKSRLFAGRVCRTRMESETQAAWLKIDVATPLQLI